MCTSDNKKYAIGVFSDLRKAFHTVDHKIVKWVNVTKSVQFIKIMSFVSQSVTFIVRFK